MTTRNRSASRPASATASATIRVRSDPHWLGTYTQVALEGSAILFSDITARREVEEALRESESRFRNMADHAPMMIWVTEPDGSCSYLSEPWYHFTGQTPETGLGTGWLRAVHPEDREITEEAFRVATESRTGFQLDYRVRRHDGEYRWALDAATPRIGTDGSSLGFIGSVIDITDRKHLERAIQDSEERFRTMANNLPLIVWVHNERGEQEFVNDTFCEYFGVSREEMTGGRWQMLTHPGDRTAYIDEFTACLHQRRPFHSEVRVRRADGQWRWLESWAQPQFDSDRGFTGFLGTSADITERKQAEAALLEHRAEEHRVAARLQQALLPRAPMCAPGVEIATRYIAAADALNVGGDWYVSFLFDDGRIGLAVGDVVGHNIEAAAAMGADPQRWQVARWCHVAPTGERLGEEPARCHRRDGARIAALRLLGWTRRASQGHHR